jgi:hypothetical protein
MGKKILHNSFDSLVDNLTQTFKNIPNFDLMINDEAGNKIFQIIAFRLSEIISYKTLVSEIIILNAKKEIIKSKNIIRSSHYSSILNNPNIDFEESIHEIVRFSYVGLFHKYENFINDLIKIPDILFGDIFDTPGTVEEWAKEKFGFKIKDWNQFKITHKVNWISNCTKHKDGYPIKLPRPQCFENIEDNIRIKIEPKEFADDCESLIQFYPIILQTMFMFAQHKMVSDKPLIENSESYEKMKKLRDEADSKMKMYLEEIKML